jgi:general secretion pathway protein F/type IV pilus assembly protein PilC
MLYRYKGITKDGKSSRGTLEASSVDEVKKRLKSQGILYQNIEATKEITLKNFSKREMSGPLLSSFAKELSSYLNSGMAILLMWSPISVIR